MLVRPTSAGLCDRCSEAWAVDPVFPDPAVIPSLSVPAARYLNDLARKVGDAMVVRCCRDTSEAETFARVGRTFHATADRLVALGRTDPRSMR